MFKVFVLALLALPMTLFAGGSDGGGGNGVVCYNPENAKEIVSVELLDFYEGRVLEGYEFSDRPGSHLEIYEQIIEKSASKQVGLILKSGIPLNKGLKLLPAGVRLHSINDSGEIFVPENCKVEQIANFQGPSRIFIVSDFWKHLNETNKAGLLMHELLWWKERQGGYKTSARARRTVARLFADNYQFDKVRHEAKTGDLYCVSKLRDSGFHKTSMFVSIIDENKCRFSFETINGTPAFTRQEFIHDLCPMFLNLTEVPYATSTHHEVASFPENIITHEVRINTSSVGSGESRNVVHSIQMSNLEFPGFDDEEDSLYCRPLSEEDINGHWWE